MNFILKMVADMLLKGLGPINGWKTVAGIIIAIIGLAAQQLDIAVPVLGNDITSVVGYLIAAFGLGHKGGKA